MFTDMLAMSNNGGTGATLIDSRTGDSVKNTTLTVDAGKYIIVVTGQSGTNSSASSVVVTVNNGTLTKVMERYYAFGYNQWDYGTKVYELVTSAPTVITFGPMVFGDAIYKV